MGIRSLVAAVAMVVGVGQAAEAATLQEGYLPIKFTLTSAGMSVKHSTNDFSENWSEYWGMAVGSTVDGSLSIYSISDAVFSFQVNIPTGTTFSGVIREAFAGIWRGYSPVYDILYNAQWDGTKGKIEAGGQGVWIVDGVHMGERAWAVSAEIVLEPLEPAPVPLPATAALLPLGLGALAMLRRRRRAVS